MRRRKRPSRTRRHRESVARKRRARAFYRMRGGGVVATLPQDEAEALRPWRGCGVAVLVMALVAAAGWIAAMLFS